MEVWFSVDKKLPREDALVVAARFYKGMPPDMAVCQIRHNEFVLWEDGLDVKGDAKVVLDFDVECWMYIPGMQPD